MLKQGYRAWVRACRLGGRADARFSVYVDTTNSRYTSTCIDSPHSVDVHGDGLGLQCEAGADLMTSVGVVSVTT